MRRSKHRLVWLVLLLLTVGGLQPVVAWELPWELFRWELDNKQPPLRTILVEDYFEMSGEAKFWFIRGYLLSSWYWAEMTRTEQEAFVKDQLKWFFPINEMAMQEYMMAVCLEKVWRKQPMYSAFPEGWIYYRSTGQITFVGEK